MNEETIHKKAEEILTDDSLLTESGEVLSCPGVDEEELLFSRSIQRSLLNQRKEWSSDEKAALQQQINQSLRKADKTMRLTRFASIAAILLIAFTATFVVWQSQRSGVLYFALNHANFTPKEQTRLIFEQGEEFDVETTESEIKYSLTNNSIKIDTLRQINALNHKKSYHTLLVPFGKRTKITLSDNTIVWVNSGSKLVYPSYFDKKKREVFLEGEAIFDVAHQENSSFHVLTKNMEVKVLGTIFSLCAYDDESSVSAVLQQGLIELKYKKPMSLGYSHQTITPGMMVVYCPKKGNLHQSFVNSKNYMSWKDGYVILEKKTLGYITRKLSRYYNIPIQIEEEDLAEETFSGYLDLRNTAQQVLDIISEVINIDVEAKEEQIIITRKADDTSVNGSVKNS